MIWGCMLWEGVGGACKIDGNGRVDGDLYIKILEGVLQSNFLFMTRPPGPSSSSRIMIPNTITRRPKIGSKTMI